MRYAPGAGRKEVDGMESRLSPVQFVVRVWAFHILFHTVWVLLFIAGITGLMFLIPFNALYFSFVLGFMGPLSPEISLALGYAVFSLTGISSGIMAVGFPKTSVLTTGFLSVGVAVVFLIVLSFGRLLLS